MKKVFLIKKNSQLVGTARTIQECRLIASQFETTLKGKRYKKEFCNYDEIDGIHKGYHFTLFDED